MLYEGEQGSRFELMHCFLVLEKMPKWISHHEKKPKKRVEPHNDGTVVEVDRDERPMGRKQSKKAAKETGAENISAQISELLATMANRQRKEEEQDRLADLRLQYSSDREVVYTDITKISPNALSFVEKDIAEALSRLSSDYYSEINGGDVAVVLED